ncbi:MAG: hypothetical protein ABIA47_01680 [bacterium]
MFQEKPEAKLVISFPAPLSRADIGVDEHVELISRPGWSLAIEGNSTWKARIKIAFDDWREDLVVIRDGINMFPAPCDNAWAYPADPGHWTFEFGNYKLQLEVTE